MGRLLCSSISLRSSFEALLHFVTGFRHGGVGYVAITLLTLRSQHVVGIHFSSVILSISCWNLDVLCQSELMSIGLPLDSLIAPVV